MGRTAPQDNLRRAHPRSEGQTTSALLSRFNVRSPRLHHAQVRGGSWAQDGSAEEEQTAFSFQDNISSLASWILQQLP